MAAKKAKGKAKANDKARSAPKAKAASGRVKKGTAATPAATPAAMPAVEATPAPPEPRAIYQAFVTEILNGGKFELAGQFLDPVVVSHNPFPGQAPGVDGFVNALRAFRVAFPDLEVRVTHLIAEGDKVVGRFEVRGTHQGDFMGLAPTGRAVHYEEIAIVRFAGGRIVEHWAVADALAILQQLG